MIRLENINKIYTHSTGELHTLKDVNLSIAQGEIIGLIGKSGAGKSTLLRCVNLLEKPTSGLVYVNQTELTGLSAHALRQARHQIGMVFQHFNLLSTATVFDNVAFPLRLLKKNKKDIQHTVLSLLEKVGLSSYARAYPYQLSGGQKQRVAIARALATNPTVLLCDEMTSALDPETTAEILALIKSLNEEFQLSILFVTHEMAVIKSIADRVAVIDEGQIVECRQVADIFKNPQTSIAKKFTQSVMSTALPAELQKSLRPVSQGQDQTVLSFTFSGDATLAPVLNDWIRDSDVAVNILQANIEKLRQETIGSMIVSTEIDPSVLQEKISALIEKGLGVEVLGYVDKHDWVNC